MEQVAWPDVRRFLISDVERPATPKRKAIGWGQRAVRVPKGGRDHRINAPCAYFASAGTPSPGPSAPALTLYEDPEARRLLCYVEAARETDGERHHVVRDGRGEVVGTLRRIPPRRPFRHTWRIDQPGRPEIVGRNEWAAGGSPAEAAGRVAVKAALGVVGAVLDLGGGRRPAVEAAHAGVDGGRGGGHGVGGQQGDQGEGGLAGPPAGLRVRARGRPLKPCAPGGRGEYSGSEGA
ncbi:hypothetical protein [Streptomyces sp. ITFR-16]|uniref:hypothetical protein n=1 Tax=Streptomyces sp. ITFR-16 TaxID=3075198 RepID=UPI00288AE8D5|nr:hypothetical protein [Streptomyces sp. ITFR-16]WNI23511.1 hypothetical protein RLT58_17000 [Streptomyces sp. ITFR-16]